MVTGIQVHPSKPGFLFTSISRGGFYYSQNDGLDWQQLNKGLTDLDASGIVLNPQNPDQIYLLTIGGGLFTCTLPNCSWTSKNSGLPSVATDSSTLMGSANSIFEMEINFRAIESSIARV